MKPDERSEAKQGATSDKTSPWRQPTPEELARREKLAAEILANRQKRDIRPYTAADLVHAAREGRELEWPPREGSDQSRPKTSERDARFRAIHAIHEQNGDKDPAEVMADVTAAVEEVRAANYQAKIFLEQLKAKRQAALADELRQIERQFPEVYIDAKRFLELTGDVPWEFVTADAEGEARALRDKYGVHVRRQKPTGADVSPVAALFCETCDLLWLQKFPQD